MKKFIVILLTIFLFCNTQVFAKRKKSSRHRRAGGKYTKLKSNGFNINSETVGMDLNLNKIKPQNSAEQNISMTCGVPADINNNLAKRKCALVIAEGLKRFCTSFYGGESGYNDCSSKIKVQFKFNMGLPQLEGVKETIGDKECKGEELQKFCSNFEEELINGLWDIFSKPVIRKRKYCNFAKAKFYAAQECFRYIQSEKNSFANSKGSTDAFTRSRKTKLDEGIEKRCGLDAIKKAYEHIAVDKFEDGDVSEFINTNKAAFESLKLTREVLTNKKSWDIRDTKRYDTGIYQMKDHFTSDVAKIFANLGDNSYNIMGQVGKFIELKLATKSSSYPRELVTIANTFIVEGENACGQSFKTAMADTSFKLSDNRSALEKYIAEKGIIKGTYDYLIDNTVGVFAGTDKADEIKKRGWKLPPKEFDPGNSKDPPKQILFTLGNKLEKRKNLENYIKAFRNAIITFKNACTDDSKCPNNPLVSINLDKPEPPK